MIARLRLSPRLLGLIALCLVPALAIAAPPRLVGYVGSKDDPAHIEAGKLSALIYAFAHIKEGRVMLDAHDAAAFEKLRALKRQNPKLKLLISVGGWTAGGFSDAALDAASRQRFADSAMALLQKMHADGLDVDWEYPGHHESGITSRPSDKAHFTALLKAVRHAMAQGSAKPGAPAHYLLTAALADGPFVDHVNLKAVAAQLDWINAMTYDFNNSMTKTTGNHAGLFASAVSHKASDRTTARAVRQYEAAGVPANKIVIGAAFYSRAFTDVLGRDHGLYQPYGKYVASYPWPQLVAKYIDKNGFKRYWDAKAKAPYLWNAKTRTFITYDDPQSLRAKAVFVKRQHLGGIMYWEQSLDPHNTLFDALAKGLGR
ncbi:glycoside hydrolase family 18 protein [Oleiagrimonas sp. C23AA]|uniref:glycoside hydrolase family 18 protein n=1 Tax=Oleiagrimonas sp. C23AA TaxID=2719047 RepID=UPI00141E1325|nr:glycoside hydrolase family 18 protein [Oleiagrimonas sp. C23AA]NII11977.1 glycoside hydrolase family 18 protein [Oleiagrimonas sp. C23AA]